MSVVAYWRERIVKGEILYSPDLMVPRYNVKFKNNEPTPWPYAVAKQALWQDYNMWHEDVFTPPYKNVPYFDDNPDSIPSPVKELHFFTTLNPFLYIVDAKQQTRTYQVADKVHYEGEWVNTTRGRNFVRLAALEDHRAAFMLATGTAPEELMPEYDMDSYSRMAQAVARLKANTQRERDRMQKAMASKSG